MRISDSEAGVKEEKSGGVVGEEGACGHDVVASGVAGERQTEVGYSATGPRSILLYC